jgi:uncharacterized iron-regulated membrane protein
MRAAMRQRIRMLHLTVALVAALFVVTLGVTGSIMAFETELDYLVHRDLWHVEPGGRLLTLEEIRDAVGRQYPGERISSYTVSPAPDLACRVLLPGKPLYVNPYTGAVIGVAATTPDVLARIHQLHLRLSWLSHPDAGKAIVSWMDVAMLFLLATGLYLWWPLKRFSIRRDGPPRRFWLDVHASTGIAVFGFLLLAGVTGGVIGFDAVAGPALYRVTGSAPAERPPHVVTPSPEGPISPDRAMAIAAAAIPGATPFQIAIPPPKGTYGVRLRFPEDLTPGGRSRVEIDQYTGEVVFAEGSRTAPAGSRAIILNRAIHTGDVFGLPSKILMSLASALTVVMAVSGLFTWWVRRGRQGD